jgi:hypothetical protein
MKHVKIFAGLAATAAALTFTPFANAGENQGFQLDKAVYKMAETINIAYDTADSCEGRTKGTGFINGYSSEFVLDQPNTMRATAQASWVPGNYVAEMVCGGEKVVRPFQVVQNEDLTFFLDKQEVEAGGEVTVMKKSGSGCGDAANSPGFVSRIELKQRPDGMWTGTAKVVDKPGTYQVAMLCYGAHTFQNLTVLPKAAEPTTPVTGKPISKAVAKAPIVKPKGAPQTGGGGTAR